MRQNQRNKKGNKENTSSLQPQPSTSGQARPLRNTNSQTNISKSNQQRQSTPSSFDSDSESEDGQFLKPKTPPRLNQRPPIRKQTQSSQPPAETTKPSRPTGAAKRKQATPRLSPLHQLFKLVNSTEPTIPKAPFTRLVREILHNVMRVSHDFRITPQALEALRESSEHYITATLADAYLITLNRKQVTLQPRDLHLIMFFRGSRTGQGFGKLPSGLVN